MTSLRGRRHEAWAEILRARRRLRRVDRGRVRSLAREHSSRGIASHSLALTPAGAALAREIRDGLALLAGLAGLGEP